VKERFLKAMAFMYPDGVPWGGHQHRDLVRIFMMGYGEALMATGQDEEMAQFIFDWKHTADVNWWPDETWRWA
jgi:hypothetical protein